LAASASHKTVTWTPAVQSLDYIPPKLLYELIRHVDDLNVKRFGLVEQITSQVIHLYVDKMAIVAGIY
jgi:hypothetical protein